MDLQPRPDQLRAEIDAFETQVATLQEQVRTFLEHASAAYSAAGMPHGDSLIGLLHWARKDWGGLPDPAIVDTVQALILWSQRDQDV